MRWVKPRLDRRRLDERGATLIIVSAIAVTALVMAAFVMDVGALLQERRELQNGADAGALAVAHSCALSTAVGDCLSDSSAAAAAVPYAGANALDNKANVAKAHVDKTARTVNVRTTTKTASGKTVLPFSFGRVIGLTGGTVHAAATAAWGPPKAAKPIPLALSICEFDAAGLDVKTLLVFHSGSKGAGTCNRGSGGKDVSGGFGWLDATDGCTAALTAGGNVSADTGASIPKECDLGLLMGKTILIPVFDLLTPSGTKSVYHIIGFGAFLLTGYRFPSTSGGSPVPCKSPDTCLSGKFVHFIQLNDAGPIGGADFAVSVIRLVS